MDDDRAREYLEKEAPQERTWKAVLYETREYFDESRGRKVRETAV